jgi:hypothetical protein
MCTRASVPIALIAGVTRAGGHGEPADDIPLYDVPTNSDPVDDELETEPRRFR